MKVTQLLARKDGLKDHDATFAKNRVHLIGVPPPALKTLTRDSYIIWADQVEMGTEGYFT